ncbi:nucleic acid/nucleotide deaminase domain-containing protein [Streptomyces sp. NBC_00365]|uniref:nucleic acid/nucleotide deaminase domain-containing protein n=1 Tax=Streptomyces sp. NBC_00365 TaxID=2975726 RepID=UPI00338FDCAC
MVANSKFSGHSETEILDQLKEKGVDPKKITALYIERQPCDDCAGALEKALKEGTVITYSVPYTLEIASYSRPGTTQHDRSRSRNAWVPLPDVHRLHSAP